jgi:hypothetical protein
MSVCWLVCLSVVQLAVSRLLEAGRDGTASAMLAVMACGNTRWDSSSDDRGKA